MEEPKNTVRNVIIVIFKIFFYMFALFFVLIVIGIIVTSFRDNKPPAKKESSQVFEKQEKPADDTKEAKKALESPANDLKEAKEALEMKTEDEPLGYIHTAEGYLNRIKKSDKEYPEAQKLLKKIQKLKKKQEDLDEKKIANEKKQRRLNYATILEELYLEKGMNVYVSVQGKDSNILKIKWIFVSRPFVHKVTKDQTNIETWEEMGFKKIIFTDGYREKWELKLSP